MNEKRIRYWAHYIKLRNIIGCYIGIIFAGMGIIVGCTCLANSEEIDAGIEGALEAAVLQGFEYYGVVMAVYTVITLLWLLWRSDRVELTDTSILYYRTIFSKQAREIDIDRVTKCVFNGRIWVHTIGHARGLRILVLTERDALITFFDLNRKLCVAMLRAFPKKCWLVGESRRLKTVDNYFKIDFSSLTIEEQWAAMKDYCNGKGDLDKTGEEMLRKIRKKTRKK